MSQSSFDTVLSATVGIFKDLLTSGNKVDAEKLGELISDVGDRLLHLKNKEDGTTPVGTPVRATEVKTVTAPSSGAVAATKYIEAPALEATIQQAPATPTNEAKKSGQEKVVEGEVVAKRKPGRPKGSGKKNEKAITTEAIASDVILPGTGIDAESQQEISTEEQALVFDNPDPMAPNYKFKHLRDRFGVNPDGSAKRFNDMTEDETFDGEMVISLFDGKRGKMLKRHLGKVYDMTDKEYVVYFGLSPKYRPVGKDFSASKSIDAKKTKLGHKKDEDEVLEEKAEQSPIATPENTPAKAERRTRTRTNQAA